MDWICLIPIVTRDGLFVFIISGLFSDIVSVAVLKYFKRVM